MQSAQIKADFCAAGIAAGTQKPAPAESPQGPVKKKDSGWQQLYSPLAQSEQRPKAIRL